MDRRRERIDMWQSARAARARYACVGKVRHPSKKNATATARALAAHDGSQMNAYRCTYCKKWHVGHVMGSREDPARRRFGVAPHDSR